MAKPYKYNVLIGRNEEPSELCECGRDEAILGLCSRCYGHFVQARIGELNPPKDADVWRFTTSHGQGKGQGEYRRNK